MKIKKLQIIGFKSFMEKTIFTFPEKITSIVGPNGCGKSNLVDSIRWAIGEQSSKHLRGKGMDDMIFNGSEKHSPLGMAEVSITFTNDSVNVPIDYSEYNEITVSRRIYKSGESEYKINNTQCRLMDIKELFMDTGISAKAYAIIEQGKVETIVNSKPEDKRIIIEEAAGITKYKNRKESALKKIESTKQNLQRTKDILSEIKKQLNSIEKQAKRAEEFKKLRKRLKEIELKLIHLENIRINKGLWRIEEELKRLDESSLDVSKKMKVKENETESLRIKSLEIEKKLGSTQEIYLNRLNEVKKKENEIEFKERQKEELLKHKNNNKLEIEELKSRIKYLKKETEDSRQNLKKADDEFYKEEKKILYLQSEYEKLNSSFKDKTNLTDKEKSELVNILTNIARTRNDLSNFENHIASFAKGLEKLKKEEDFIKEQILKITKDIKDLNTNHSQIEKEKSILKRKGMQNELKLDELRDSFNEKEEKTIAIENELKDITARLNSLTDLKSAYEGFDAGVKAIMSARDGLDFGDDILGVVNDFIEVEPAYEMAVSSFLGEKLEYIVMKSKKSIIKAVEYLKENDMGKAGFILLENSGAAKRGNPGSSHISKCVKIDGRAKEAVLDLIGDTHYIKRFEDAIKHYQNNNKKTYVTKDGDIISDTIYGGGGKSVKAVEILKREREIKESENERIKLKNKFTLEEKAINKIKTSINNAETEQENIKDSLHEVQIKSIELQSRINRAKEEEDRLKERDKIIKYESKDLKTQLDEINNKLLLSKVKLEKFLSNKEKKEEIIEKYTDECGGLKRKQDYKSEELTVARVNVARLKAKRENIAGSIEHLRQTLDSSSKRTDKLKNDIEIIDKEAADIKLKVKAIERELKESIIMSEKDKDGVEKLKEAFEKNMTHLRKGELESSNIKNELNDIISKKNEFLLKKEEALLNIKHIENRLGEKYQKSLRELESIEIAKDFDKESAVKKLEMLRKKIYDMGEVNLLAIEEFEELNKRYTFITEQKEDLLKSIDTLNKAIKRINKTSKKRFKETFDLVNEKFKLLFPRLFNGGHAELQLKDEENLLETGVEIVAQPPGKKLQNISLLSGGEKALTAVGLIFAIFMVKPSPFCLLDEVDAPLDDANIGRFNELVKEMAQTSQFIIITHNKNTMEAADILYGVTMETPGISKIVSVKMN
jgi:chromosome segregation protein